MDTPRPDPTAWTVLAHLLRPQGRKGEILAELHTDFPESLAGRAGLMLQHPSQLQEPAAIEASWLPVGRKAGRVVLKFKQVDSIEAAERLSQCDLVTPSEQRVALAGKDEEYIADLLDCAVFDGERLIGTIDDVQFPLSASGARLEDATPLLVVKDLGGEDLLIPYANDWIVTLDIEAKRLVMRLPEGLLEINVANADQNR